MSFLREIRSDGAANPPLADPCRRISLDARRLCKIHDLGILAPPLAMRQKGPLPFELVENATQNPVEIPCAEGVAVFAFHTPVPANVVAHSAASLETELDIILAVIVDDAVGLEVVNPVGVEQKSSPASP